MCFRTNSFPAAAPPPPDRITRRDALRTGPHSTAKMAEKGAKFTITTKMNTSEFVALSEIVAFVKDLDLDDIKQKGVADGETTLTMSGTNYTKFSKLLKHIKIAGKPVVVQRKCKICDELGHNRRTCPKKPAEEKESVKSEHECPHCGKEMVFNADEFSVECEDC